MSKTLKTTQIANELEQSAHFNKPGPRQRPVEPRKQPLATSTTPRPPQKLKTPERIIVRSSFDIYEDQQISLAKIKITKKQAGEKRGVSDLIREALDNFIKQEMNKRTNK